MLPTLIMLSMDKEERITLSQEDEGETALVCIDLESVNADMRCSAYLGREEMKQLRDFLDAVLTSD